MIEIYLILLFMIASSIVAVEAKDLLSSVIAVGAVGIGLAMGFVVLKAPDLAIMQLVVEILILVILIRATINKDLPLVKDGRWLFNTISTFAFIVMFLVCAYLALKELPSFGEPLMRTSAAYIEDGQRITGSANIVAAITLNFRSLDVLAEAAVLFAAITGVLAITRKTGKLNEK